MWKIVLSMFFVFFFQCRSDTLLEKSTYTAAFICITSLASVYFVCYFCSCHYYHISDLSVNLLLSLVWTSKIVQVIFLFGRTGWADAATSCLSSDVLLRPSWHGAKPNRATRNVEHRRTYDQRRRCYPQRRNATKACMLGVRLPPIPEFSFSRRSWL